MSTPAPTRSRLLIGLLALAPFASPARAADRDGAAIYKDACVRCHGASGEGSKDYKKPLIGDRTVGQLAKQIAKTMPEDDPGSLKPEEAEKVAAYIHETFYSRLAQAKNKPARVEMARLTVRQYLNAVADLVGSFRGQANWDRSKQGLNGQYYKNRRFRSGDKAIDRLDPGIAFDFGVKSPEPGKMEDHEFSIRWEGSVYAPETGTYDFIIKTDHAARLWVNSPAVPLIDAWVKSGKDTEFKASIPLLGGRAYTLRMEFSKAKQGVDDSAKNKDKPKPEVKAFVALEWKPPHGPVETVPARFLSPVRNPELYVVETPFPPDDRSIGYERGTSISKAWDNATTDAAIAFANYVSDPIRLRELAGVKDDTADRTGKMKEFTGRLAERAFRRPLSAEEKAFYIDRQFQGAKTPDLGLKRAALLVLKSPRFLYHSVPTGEPDGYEVASRLALALWDSLPDKPLLEAAAQGKLKTRDQIAAQADRMLGDLRGRSKIHGFLLQWLNVEQHPDIAKDAKTFPGFDAQLIADLRASLELGLDDVVWGESSDFRQFLLGDGIFLNDRLAKYYGAKPPEKGTFAKVAIEPTDRAGVLTHPYLLAAYAYTGATSPIHRGVFVSRSLLGRALRPPPIAVAPLAPDLHPSLTTRERVITQTQPAACQSCHAMINPLGFGLEHFDAVGRYRKEEKGKPIDATGHYDARSGDRVPFKNARELAAFIARSEEAQDAFVEQLFQYLVKQPLRAYGPDSLAELRSSFAANQFHIRKLIVEILARSVPVARERPTTTASK